MDLTITQWHKEQCQERILLHYVAGPLQCNGQTFYDVGYDVEFVLLAALEGYSSLQTQLSLQPRSDSFPSLSDKEHLTLGQPTAVKLRIGVLPLDLLEACKKSSVILQGI